MKSEYLLVHKSVLPEYYEIVIKCREAVEGENMNVSEACKKYKISRGTYYKYKDLVFKEKENADKAAIIQLRLDDRKGVLSTILNTIFAYHGNVKTINQNMPINGLAFVILAVSLDDLSIDVTQLVQLINEIDGVKLVEILAIQ